LEAAVERRDGEREGVGDGADDVREAVVCELGWMGCLESEYTLF
jgi:hypothetical protein